MMRILQSPWIALLLGVLSYFGTTVACWRMPTVSSSGEGADSHELLSKPETSWAFHNPEVDQLVQELKKEKEALNVREKQLNDLALRLQSERLELNQVTQRVYLMQQEFDQNVVRIRDEETANLKKLAKVYAAMTPDGALPILKELPDEQIVKILVFMKDSESAPLLEGLAKAGDAEAKRAALISERIRLSLPRTGGTKARSP